MNELGRHSYCCLEKELPQPGKLLIVKGAGVTVTPALTSTSHVTELHVRASLVHCPCSSKR